jgi:hypothetical protein
MQATPPPSSVTDVPAETFPVESVYIFVGVEVPARYAETVPPERTAEVSGSMPWKHCWAREVVVVAKAEVLVRQRHRTASHRAAWARVSAREQRLWRRFISFGEALRRALNEKS